MIITLRTLCEQPDLVNVPIVAISESGIDKLKVTLARNINGEYKETRFGKICSTTEAAYEFAQDVADIINTPHIYEIRIFKDDTSEVIRIPKEKRKIAYQVEAAQYSHIPVGSNVEYKPKHKTDKLS